MNENEHMATFAAGCFWCIEAQFLQLNGVTKVVSGYIGGHIDNPTYEQVCNGDSGHAEAINVYFDSNKITYNELLAAFWQSHDPTQLNRQGNDIGTQYRSAIFYHSEEQKEKATSYKEELDSEHIYDNPIVTEISPYDTFYNAEEYHQDYYSNNKNQGYCMFVIQPKLEKFKKVFADKLK